MGKEQARMQYLVTEELINPGPQLPPDQLVGIMRQWVLPSMDTLINLKSEGKIIAGGVPVGERALVLIFEAESNEELDSILQRLPLWGLAKWKVTPLENLEGRTARDRQFIEQLEQSLQRYEALTLEWSRGIVAASALLRVLIHRSAWKGNSANFALTAF